MKVEVKIEERASEGDGGVAVCPFKQVLIPVRTKRVAVGGVDVQ